jgi:predicted TIM-barrel fold metal-dependent hydrolase
MKSKLVSIFLLILFYQNATSQIAVSQPEKKRRPPIIDIHVHAMPVNPGFAVEMCPWFLYSMPGSEPKNKISFSVRDNCPDPLKPAKNDDEMMKAFIEAINRLNITAVAFGDPKILHRWKSAAPDRIIPGIGVSKPEEITVGAMRDSLSTGYFKVMAECAPQYNGVSPSDMSLDAYFAVAEKLDIPVGIHMGTGGNGMANLTSPNFRAAMGDPLLLEDLLHRHPNLRVWIMHAGYPMIDNLLALLGANAYVYIDLSGFIWSYPLEEIHAYIKRIVQAGFEKRIMYGTDFMMWPKLLETSIGVIENASYLTEEQKRDIFYNNAARFLRLETAKIK